MKRKSRREKKEKKREGEENPIVTRRKTRTKSTSTKERKSSSTANLHPLGPPYPLPPLLTNPSYSSGFTHTPLFLFRVPPPLLSSSVPPPPSLPLLRPPSHSFSISGPPPTPPSFTGPPPLALLRVPPILHLHVGAARPPCDPADAH